MKSNFGSWIELTFHLSSSHEDQVSAVDLVLFGRASSVGDGRRVLSRLVADQPETQLVAPDTRRTHHDDGARVQGIWVV